MIGSNMKVLFAAITMAAAMMAQQPQTMPQDTQVIPLWPGQAPGAQGTEDRDIPTLTVYLPRNIPRAGAPGMTAIIVCPGGGYVNLAMNHEGRQVANYLNSLGIAAFVLKYRLGPRYHHPVELGDAQRALRMVRSKAADWHIAPDRIGIMGFSAGGHLVAAMSTHFDRRLYPAVDAADKESCRPDFAVSLYPGHLWISTNKFELNPDVPVTRQTPPTFLVQAENDNVDSINNSLVYYIALKNAGVPVEMHLYAEGKHAFGLRPTKFPITGWPQLVETWLRTIGIIS